MRQNRTPHFSVRSLFNTNDESGRMFIRMFEIILGLENMLLLFSKGNHRARLKHNTSGKLKSPVAGSKVWNLKLTRLYFFN